MNKIYVTIKITYLMYGIEALMLMTAFAPRESKLQRSLSHRKNMSVIDVLNNSIVIAWESIKTMKNIINVHFVS